MSSASTARANNHSNGTGSAANLFRLAKTALDARPSSASSSSSSSNREHNINGSNGNSSSHHRLRAEGSYSSGGLLSPPPTLARSSSSNMSRSDLVYNAASSSEQQQREHDETWRKNLTIEERMSVRDKIRNAYRGACKSYDELLFTVVAIEEELLHIAAPSRLDYFKSGCRFEQRVLEKRKQLPAVTPSVEPSVEEDAEQPAKRSKLELLDPKASD